MMSAQGPPLAAGQRAPLRSRLSAYLRFFLPALAFALLIWLLDRIGWNVLLEYVVRVGWLGGAALLTVGFLENLFQALALRRAIAYRVSIFRILAVNGTGAVVNAAIPWEAGEVAKGALLSSDVSSQELVSGLVLWNYLLKFSTPAVSLFTALVAVAVGGIYVGNGAGPAIAAACLLALVPFVLLRFFLRYGAAELTVRLLFRLRILRKRPEVVLESAVALDQKIRMFRQERPHDFVAVIAYQVLARLSSWLSWVTVLYFMDYPISFSSCALVFSGFSVATYAMAVIPARIGVNEGTGYLLFALMGLDGPTGLIASTLQRVKSLLSSGALGLFALGPRR